MERKKFNSHTNATESLVESEGLDLTDEEFHLVSQSDRNGTTAAVAALLISSKRLKKGLDNHRVALEQASEGGDKIALRLSLATWCSVVATIALVGTTFFMALKA